MKHAFRAALLLALCPALVQAQNDAALDRAFEAFWRADSEKGAEKAAEGVIASGASFATVLERLAKGRPYKPSSDKGELRWSTLPGSGASLATTIVVPKDYNPAVKYPVRFFLHGGIARPDPEEGQETGSLAPRRPRRRLETNKRYFAVYPSGYVEAQWWFFNQMTHLGEILDRLKRTYNVDENRVHLMGVSDGGTGAYFAALKNPTPWSVFFPLNGFLGVLSNPYVHADGELFTTNLKNRPIYAVNGEMDQLYPASASHPFMVMLSRAGAQVTFRVMPGAAHNTTWWPTEGPLIDKFEEEHPRVPLRDSLSWETERADRYSRVDWLVVDRLDASKKGATFDEDNTLEIQDPPDFGLRVDSRKDDGRRVFEIVAGTIAAAMGLRKGDTIVRMGDRLIQNAEDIGRAFEEHKAGSLLEFEVDRKGQRLTMQGVFPPPAKPLRKEEAFKHSKPAGRVDVVRKGNRFEARTRGVASFTLLLSPNVIDFDKAVTVLVNGNVVFDGLVARNLETLLRYAARDNDRTMLFGSALQIAVP